MNIQNSLYTPNNKTQPKFQAIPLARYQTRKNNFTYIYQLEKKDIPFLSKFTNNLQTYCKSRQIDDFSHKQVMQEAFEVAQKILESPNEQKAKVFLAINKNEPCGIIIGNASKKSHSGQIVYSSRKNHAKKETELDWLASWNPNPQSPLKGTGKTLSAEYFNTLKQDGFQDVYVRSEVPELSYAQTFYENLGFETLPNKRESIVKSTTNRYIAGDYDSAEDEIIPMVAVSSKWEKAKNFIFELFGRKDLDKISVNIDSVIN